MVVNADHRSGKVVMFDGRSAVMMAAEGVGRALRQAYSRSDDAKLPSEMVRCLDRLR